MKQLYFHPDFSLNGQKFGSVKALLVYAEEHLTDDHTAFLYQWFDDSPVFEARTSGTTGTPKVYRFSKNTAVVAARRTIELFDLEPESKALLCLSADYIAGKMMWVRALTGGWDLDVVPARREIELPDTYYDFGAMVPYQAYANRDILDSFNLLLLGGAPVKEDFIDEIEDLEMGIFLSYGMTETLTHVALRPLTFFARHFFPVAVDRELYYALPFVEFKTDESGRLIVRDPLTLNEPLQTQDLVELISPKKFYWLGRAGNVINSGGHKVFAEAVEQALSPFVHLAFYVTGLPDAQLGERVVMVVEGSRDDFPPEIVRDAIARAGLHPYDRPKEVFYVSAFRRTASGKIIRDFSREEL